MASIGGKKFSQLRVVDLKELEKRNLDKSGLKAASVKRLEKSLLEEATDLFDAENNNDEADSCNGELTNDSTSKRKGLEGTQFEELHDLNEPTVGNDTATTTATGNKRTETLPIPDIQPKEKPSNSTLTSPATMSENLYKECSGLSIEIAEVKLDLAMLWAIVNSIQDNHHAKPKEPLRKHLY